MFKIPGVEAVLGALGAFALCWAVATWWVIPRAEDAARTGYVKEARALSAEKLVKELQRQAKASQVVIEAYQVQYKNAIARYEQQDLELEKAIEANEKQRDTQGRRAPLTIDDLKFLCIGPGGVRGRCPT